MPHPAGVMAPEPSRLVKETWTGGRGERNRATGRKARGACQGGEREGGMARAVLRRKLRGDCMCGGAEVDTSEQFHSVKSLCAGSPTTQLPKRSSRTSDRSTERQLRACNGRRSGAYTSGLSPPPPSPSAPVFPWTAPAGIFTAETATIPAVCMIENHFWRGARAAPAAVASESFPSDPL
eukprot:scaffold4009_cov101-Isochrysis_galbana.AAC.4